MAGPTLTGLAQVLLIECAIRHMVVERREKIQGRLPNRNRWASLNEKNVKQKYPFKSDIEVALVNSGVLRVTYFCSILR